MKQYTYIMIKPDGVRQGLTSEIVKRIHAKGFEIKLFDQTTSNMIQIISHLFARKPLISKGI